MIVPIKSKVILMIELGDYSDNPDSYSAITVTAPNELLVDDKLHEGMRVALKQCGSKWDEELDEKEAEKILDSIVQTAKDEGYEDGGCTLIRIVEEVLTV